MQIFWTLRTKFFTRNNGMNVTVHRMWSIFQVTIAASTQVAALYILLSTLVVWYMWRVNTKVQCMCLMRSSWNVGRMLTNILRYLQTGILFMQRKFTSLKILILHKVEYSFIRKWNLPMHGLSSALMSMVRLIYSVWYKNIQGLHLFYFQYTLPLFIITDIFHKQICWIIFHPSRCDPLILCHCWKFCYKWQWYSSSPSLVS